MNGIDPKKRALGVLFIGMLLVGILINRLHLSSGKSEAQSSRAQITVERLPSSEARTMGVDIRKH